jgi:SAM-dependent methyltransferase
MGNDAGPPPQLLDAGSARLGWSSGTSDVERTRARSAQHEEDVVTIEAFAFPVDATNAEQASDWDGPDGEYWAKYHEEYERLLGAFDSILVDAGDVRSHDRSLDVGCGTGATTRALAARTVDGSACGLDLSGPMLEIAREAASRANIRNVEFVQGDAQVHPFEPASFDVAVSRFGCMFFGDPAAAFANVGRALRPGGRLALTVWQEPAANGWITAIDTALGEPPSEEAAEATEYVPGPFSLADSALCIALLQRAGFVDVTVGALDIPLAFGTVNDAQAFLETWIGEDLDEDKQADATASLHRLLLENATAQGVLMPSATWLVTARRPGGR